VAVRADGADDVLAVPLAVLVTALLVVRACSDCKKPDIPCRRDRAGARSGRGCAVGDAKGARGSIDLDPGQAMGPLDRGNNVHC
jgi:hypothetical protein